MAQNWRNYANYYVKPYIGERDVQDIDGAVCDALYAKLLAEGRIKAKPKTAPTKQPVHVRRVSESGMLSHADRTDMTRCAAIGRTPRMTRYLASRSSRPSLFGKSPYCSQGGAASGPGTQNGRQHASDASPRVGRLRDLGLGQAQCRLRCASATRSAQGPQSLDGQPATDVLATLAS